MTAKKLATNCRDWLHEAEIKVGGAYHLPRLVLTIFEGTDVEQPDAVALTAVLAVHQTAWIERLDQASDES